MTGSAAGPVSGGPATAVPVRAVPTAQGQVTHGPAGPAPAGILGRMSSRTVSPVFAGREAELTVLTGAFERAAGGDPATVLVGAEAGGGKSRLVSEFADRVRTAAGSGGPLILSGGCVEMSAAALPYAPFTAALRELIRDRGAADVAALLPGQAAGDLARLIPEFGEPTASTDAGTARMRLFGQLLALFERLAERLPLVLIIEDAHWADRSTRDLLSFLIRSLRRTRVLLVVTFRSDELHRTHPLRPLLAELARVDGVIRLELPRLNRAEVGAQLEGILGQPPEAGTVQAVYERSDGIPLFVEAMVDADGTVARRLPESLRDLLLGTVNNLPEETQRVLRIAAAGGTRISHPLLCRVAALGDAELTAALRPAAAANVIAGDQDGYAFRHELIREAVEDDLLAGERAQAHRAYAEALEHDPSLSPEFRISAQLAAHWRAAHDNRRALLAAWQAAADAGAAFSHAEQLQMLDQVLELWDEVPDAAARTGTDHAGVLMLAARAAHSAAEVSRGLKLARAALAELDEARDPERVATLLYVRSELRRHGAEPGSEDDLWSALRLASRPTHERARILGRLCMCLLARDQQDEARPLAEEMVTLTTELGDRELQLEARINIAVADAHDGGDVLPALQAAKETAEQIGAWQLALECTVYITHLLEGRGRHDAAIEAGRDGFEWSKRLGLARGLGTLICGNTVESLISAGRLDEALEMLEGAFDAGPVPKMRAFLLMLRCEVALARDEQETARTLLDDLRTRFVDERHTESVLPLRRLAIEAKQAEGDAAGALAEATAAVTGQRMDADPRYVWPLLVTAMRACAEAVQGTAGPDAGRRQLAGLMTALSVAAEKAQQPGPVERAHAATFAAEARRARGEPDRGAWDAAAGAWEELGRPYPLAYALMRSAAAASANGDRDGAAARLTRSAELAAGLRASRLLRQIGTLARRARIGLPSGDGQGETAVPLGLTARELDVLRLVADGRSNRDIAAELFISVKTASVHVSNILGKLGVASRGEAAATAHRLHLFDPA